MAVDIYLYILYCIILSLYYCSGDQNIWHSYQMGSGYANREELAITKVITDNNFTVEENVLAWKTLPGNGRVYGIGMSKNAIVVLNIELSIDGKRFVARKKVAEFPWEITGIELFQHWNSESRKLEIILISATLNDNYSELKWYKINGVDLELFWTWPIQKKISYMRSFQLENEKYRLLILNDTLDLYEFSVNSPKPNFWLSQTLSLSSPANSSAINFYGPDTYLSIPQKQQNEVRIYKMVRDHFVFWNKISSNNVNQVASFKIGFKSFLAINGENPSIYKFVKDNIEVENVNGIHLSNVDFWLPVPIKSYRDEVALILQRTVDHNTHQSNSLDVLLYDGHNFNTPEEVPCSFYGEAAHGLDCMVDEDGYHGLVGVAVVSLKDILGILVPHKSKNVMFMMETVLKERKSPVEIEIEKLIETREQLQSLVVDGITFAIANGIKSEDLIYKTDEFVTINGNLVFEKFVEISGDVTTSEGAVNNLTLMNEVVEMKKTYDDSFEFEHVRVSNKLNTAQANKIPIQKTFADIVGDFSSNVDTLDLDSVEMLGNITVESVNGENFDLFKNSLCLIDVDTYIPGETFMADNLHVHDSANIQYLNGLKFPEDYLFTQSDFVEGNITGPFVDKFLPNPGLLDSNSINAKVNFKTLIVEGNIIVSENYNKQKLQDLLQDVIYMTDGYALISSAKNFSRGLFVTNGITTASQQINSIPLSSIITTNTAQTITMKTLNGAVVFQNLLVQGLYGDINITKLDQETVKLSGDQFLSSTLTFVNNGAMVDLTATKMEISDTLNEFPVNNYYYDSDGSADMDINLIDLSKVQARKIIIEGNLLGSIDNFSLQEFDEKRLSATRRQQITAKYTIRNLDVENLNAKRVNGELFRKLFDHHYYLDHISNSFTAGDLHGDLYLNHLKLFDFNGVPFKLFTDYVVYKGEENPVINGFKTFLNGFRVTRMLNSEHLNRIHVDNILTKSGKQEVRGPLSIYGNVVINYDTEVYGSLNGIAMSYLRNTYQYENNTCIHIKQNLNVKNNINDVDFSEFVEDIVVITKDDVIGGDVTFAQPVYVEHELVVDNNLETKYLSGADLDNWKENAVFTDRGIIPGKLMFEYVTIQGEVYLNYINDLDLKSLIPLRTDQYINQSLQFLEITPFHNISVQNQVNGYGLLDEYHNSILMDHYLHEVASDTAFDGNVLVRNNLQIVGLVDGKNLSKVVTTNTEQKLTANYEFHNEITIRGNLEVAGWINDIDVKEWNVRSVKTNHEFEQVISDNWTLSDSMVFSENVFGDALLQGIDVVQLADTVEKKRLMKVSAENGIVDDYKNICKDVNIMMKAAETQIYLFKYFEHLQNFKFSSEIENVHHFEANDKDYILITNKSSCTSELLAWFKTEFSKISIIRTGTISQMISVRSDNLLFFVSRSSEFLKDCKYFGTNIWKFDHQGLVPFYKLENYKLLEESLIPGTFYALSDDFVVEYHLHMKEEDHVKIHRKWRISNDNWRFVPKGSGLGLCLSNGYKLLKLNRYDLIEESEYGYGTDVFLRGHVVEEYTKFIPPRNEGDITIMNVGIGNYKRSLVAVTSHDKTSVKGKFDFVKIYEDIVTGKLFHKVPTYKPSSLLSLEFGNNGETLLIFLEDQKLIQVYEYKGIEGCKHKTTIKVPGTKLFSMTVPTEKKHTRNRIVGIVNGHDLTLLNAVMTGNQISIEHPHCKL
ncbi:hypothetical protein RI129_007569 [Pyrocoelia pectoralis]|uniref:Uncharacterized protein n=1 Tax=Pyrocoelia pectoralis TaxID=417401 RepID=A0AAN7VGQ3_9COLE